MLSSSVLIIQAAERESCVVCGMYLDLYARTRYVLTFDDGTIQSTCSLACAAQAIEKGGHKVRDVKVADCLTGDLIDARKAVYLEGSDIPGVMSYTSRLAFTSREKALSFQKKHGGTLISFDEALRNQLSDRK